jgi:tetratricopeptide (TPR) repeat protein
LTRHPNAYGGLATAFIRLNRFQEAKEVIVEARSQGIDNRDLRLQLYTIASLLGDPAAMIEQVRWASGKPDEAFMMGLQANAAAVSGQMERAREFFRQAIAIAQRHGLKNAATEWTADAARWEAFFGDQAEACALARKALEDSRDWRILIRAAVTFARCGLAEEAESLAAEISQRAPAATMIQNLSLPIVRASIELARGNAAEALRLVETPRTKLARVSLWPAYLAGEAYMLQRSGRDAYAEFQQVVDHRGVEPFSPVCPLGRLGQARALAIAGDKEKGRKAYQDFFALWKNADPDAPLFRLALSEYAGLK